MTRLVLLLVALLPGLLSGRRRRLRILTFRFYNLAPVGERGRNDAELVRRELRALANLNPRTGRRLRGLRRPKVIGVCEAVGRDLPRLLGYRLIRDRSRPSRGNLALYVVWWLPVTSVRWVDLELDWWRPKSPNAKHPGRSILVVRLVGFWTVIVGHAPQAPAARFPSHVNRTLAAARLEWTRAMAGLMESRGPVTALTDPNALGARLVRLVARKISESVSQGGTPVESVHALKAILREVFTPGAVNGEPMRSDHGRALLGKAEAR